MPDVSYFYKLPFRWSMTAAVSSVFACIRVVAVSAGTAGRVTTPSAASSATGARASAAGVMRVRVAIMMVIASGGTEAFHRIVTIVPVTMFVIHAAWPVQFRTHVAGVPRSFRARFESHTARVSRANQH